MRKSGVVLPLKALVVACGAVFALAAVFLVPYAGHLVAGTFSFRVGAGLCAAYLYLTMIPAALALADGWKIFCDIGRDQSFSRENAARLRRVSLYAAVDTALYGALCAGAYAFGYRAAGESAVVNYTAFITLIITFFGALLTVVVRALSALVLDAARLKDENDLTV